MNKNMQIYAVPDERGMAIYLRDQSSRSTYVMSHRRNPELFAYLKIGRSLREVRAYRPDKNRGRQKLANSLSHIVNMADWVLAEQAA